MKNLYLFLFLVFICSCANKENYTFNGVVSDPVFEGHKVYLLPVDNAIAENVDSTIIKDGKFSFNGKADSMLTKIIRVKSFYPKIMQDLMVVLEKGTTEVNIGAVSYGNGTSLNNKLQQWKDQKTFMDSIQFDVFNKQKGGKENQVLLDSLLKIGDSLNKQSKANNLKMIKENINNGIGIFMFRIFFHSFNNGEKKEILALANDRFKNEPSLKEMIKEIK